MGSKHLRIQCWIFCTLFIVEVKGEIFTPQNPHDGITSYGASGVVCRDKGLPLQLKNPFDPTLTTDNNLVLLQWSKKVNMSAEGVSIMYLANNLQPVSDVDRVSPFENFGIEINPVKFEDSGVYEAALMVKSLAEVQRRTVHVTVATPPKLNSEKLEVTIVKKGNIRVVTCGQIKNLGVPPVNLVLKSGNGSILRSSYENGFLKLELDSATDEGEFSCGIEDPSPAKECIVAFDLDRWDSSLSFGQSVAPADMTRIIAGAIAGLVFVIIGIIVLIVVFKKCKNKRGKSYNTKAVEANSPPMLPSSGPPGSSDEDDSHYLPSKASSASPYAVGGIKLPENSNHYPPKSMSRGGIRQPQQIYKAPVAQADEDEESIDISRKHKYNTNPDRRSWAGGDGKKVQQPPIPMKRSKHFAVSEEGLNLIDGNEGDPQENGGGGAKMGTLV